MPPALSPAREPSRAPARPQGVWLRGSRVSHVWGEVWRCAAVILVAGILLLGVYIEPPAESRAPAMASWTVLVWLDLGLGVVSLGLMLLRRRYPLFVATVTTLLTGFSASSVGSSAISTASLATRRRWQPLLLPLGAWLVTGFVFHAVHPISGTGAWPGDVIIGLTSFAATVAFGYYIGERRANIAALHERAITAEREQAMRVAQGKLGERAQIAREMHDVLAHRISLVALHSGALAYRTDLSPEQVRETAEVVRDNANRALTELREVLGVLRAGEAADQLTDRGGLELTNRPQPTLEQLEELIDEARSLGTRIALTVHGEPNSVPRTTSRNAYRIVQESLTNARKHSPSSPVTVDIHTGTDHLGESTVELAVRSGIRPDGERQPEAPGAGLGLLGLTERAVLSGGELTYGRDRAGDWVVRARLPWAS